MRRAVTLLGALALIACSRSPEPATRVAESSVNAGPSSSPRALERICEPDQARCELTPEGDTVVRCDARGLSVTREACDAGAVCTEGGCVALGEGGPAREALLALQGEGWLNAWSWSERPSRASRRGATGPTRPSLDGEPTDWTSACAPGGYVSADTSGSARRRRTPAVAAGYLLVGHAREVLFEAGFAGEYKLWVNDALVASGERAARPGPFRDEQSHKVALRAGANAVIVELGRPARAGFWLRVRELGGAILTGALFAPASSACSAASLADASPRLGLRPDGFDVHLEPRFLGLAPRSPVPWEVEVASGGGSSKLGALAGPEAGDFVLSRPPSGARLVVKVGGERASSRALSYREGLFARVAKLREQASGWGLPAGVPAASALSFERGLGSLSEELLGGLDDAPYLEARAAELESLAGDLAEGVDPYRARTGIVRRAYRSALDGQLQPYVAFVPPSYTPDGPPLPLVVVSHGLDRLPEHALRALVGQSASGRSVAEDARHLPSFPDQGAILVAPNSFVDSGPRPMGQEDVLAVIAEMKAAYRVDPRRVSMTGYSLGGTVAFVVPLHYPSLFSAAAPLVGYPNLATYSSVRGVRHRPWEDVMIGKRSIANYAENGLHVPLYIVHGGKDDPSRSRVVSDRYKKLGYAHDLDVPEDLGHNVWDYAYAKGAMVTKLKARRSPEAPAEVHLVTGEHRFDVAYWVRLLAMEGGRAVTPKGQGFASIHARWDKAAGSVTVRTEHTHAFALALGALSPSPRRVEVDGQVLEAPEGAATVYLLREGAERWAISAERPPLTGRKGGAVAGPLDDVRRHKTLIVYGTLDPAQTEDNRVTAEHFSSFDTYAAARFPVKADVDVGEAELRGQSLVLIGNPRSNRVTAELIASLPVRFEPGALIFRGQRYEGAGVGVSFIHPNPRDPSEYVVLHAGVGRRGTLASRHLPRLAPDFLVYDEGITVGRADMLLGEREVLAGGFFDETWR